jgi:hypothetical protein
MQWGCAMKDVSWRQLGFEPGPQNYLLQQCGYYPPAAHRAEADVLSLCQMLDHVCDDGQSVMAKLLCAMAAPAWRFEATRAQYDKRHLFGMAGEHKAYEKGTEPLICLINDWRVNFQICYDLRFPVWSRNNNNYDLLVYVANWPARRAYAWRQLLIARAIENQSFVAAVNRVGTDGNQLPYQGDSCVINPMGEAIWQLADAEAVKQITISASELQEVRANLPFLQDRDHFKFL